MVTLDFKLDLSRRGEHRVAVEMTFDSAAVRSDGSELVLFMPTWTPGSYLIREYARHVEGIRATDESGNEIPVTKASKHRFELLGAPESGRVHVRYTVYGHELTVRTNDFTEQRVYWNGACLFLWPVGLPDASAEILVELPEGWSVATQLRQEATADGVRLFADDLDDVVDGPCLAGDLDVREYDVSGVRHTYVLDGLAGIEPPENFLPDSVRIVQEAAAIFGDTLPYPEYQFLSLFADTGRGGLEHRNSSTLLAPRTTFHPRKDYEDFMGLVAHELFHAWNGKRMRPVEFLEFDYENENYTELLWVIEGWTAYYDDHLCRRAGILTSKRYLEILSETISNMHRTPGRSLHPLSHSSFDAWIKLYRPDENSRNSTQSYYTHGALAALCYDLTIRAETQGAKSLDDAIAALFARSANERGYDRDDVVACLSEAAGRDLGALVTQLVDQPFEPPLEDVLAPLGLRLKAAKSDTPIFGMQFRAKELRIASVRTGTPAQEAGLSPGDEILGLNGLRVTRGNWSSVLEHCWSENTSLRLLLARRGELLEVDVEPTKQADSYKIEVAPGSTPQQTALRKGWLWEE